MKTKQTKQTGRMPIGEMIIHTGAEQAYLAVSKLWADYDYKMTTEELGHILTFIKYTDEETANAFFRMFCYPDAEWRTSEQWDSMFYNRYTKNRKTEK